MNINLEQSWINDNVKSLQFLHSYISIFSNQRWTISDVFQKFEFQNSGPFEMYDVILTRSENEYNFLVA